MPVANQTLLITLILGAVFTPAAYAASSTVFKTKDANGNVVFSDQASADAEEVQVDAPQTFTAPPKPQFSLGTTDDIDVESGPAYAQLEIVSPTHDSAFRNNAGNITVQIALSPGLQANHVLEVLIDGRVAKSQKSAAPALIENVDRGTHQFQLRIIEEESGATLQSSKAVTATLQRISIVPRTN